MTRARPICCERKKKRRETIFAASYQRTIRTITVPRSARERRRYDLRTLRGKLREHMSGHRSPTMTDAKRVSARARGARRASEPGAEKAFLLLARGNGKPRKRETRLWYDRVASPELGEPRNVRTTFGMVATLDIESTSAPRLLPWKTSEIPPPKKEKAPRSKEFFSRVRALALVFRLPSRAGELSCFSGDSFPSGWKNPAPSLVRGTPQIITTLSAPRTAPAPDAPLRPPRAPPPPRARRRARFAAPTYLSQNSIVKSTKYAPYMASPSLTFAGST